MTKISLTLDDEQTAMLDAIRTEAQDTRSSVAKALLVAVLEDDAASHGASTSIDNVVVLRNWRGAR